MHYRRFGKTDLTVSEVGIGCARIGGVFQQTTRSEQVRLVRRAADNGINFFDTADMYTQGESERLLGEAFNGDRHRVIFATKFGYVLPTQKRMTSHIKPLLRPIVTRLRLKPRQIPVGLRGTVSRQDFSPGYIVDAIERSLRRLRTDYIDVYQLHSPPVEIVEPGEFVEPLQRLQREGKIRYWGVACHSADDALACLEYTSLACIQVGFNALEQAALDAAIPRAAAQGVATIARQVYASGLLTRSIDSFRPDQIDTDAVIAERKRQQLAAYASIADRFERGRAELALKFALAEPDVSVVLLGISSHEHLDAGLAALQAPELSDAERHSLVASRRVGV